MGGRWGALSSQDIKLCRTAECGTLRCARAAWKASPGGGNLTDWPEFGLYVRASGPSLAAAAVLHTGHLAYTHEDGTTVLPLDTLWTRQPQGS